MKFLNILFLSTIFTGITSFAAPQQPVDIDVVKKELQSLRTQSAGTVSVGAYAFIETVETLQGTSPILKLQEATKVLEKFENTNSYIFHVIYDRTDYRNGTPFPHSEQGNVMFKKGAPTIFEKIPDGDYFNLFTEQTTLNTPDLVLKRKDCGGLSGCPATLPAKKVSFDYEDLRGKMFHYEVWGSDIVPFMASPLKMCWTTDVQYGEHQLPMTTCKEMKDFTN